MKKSAVSSSLTLEQPVALVEAWRIPLLLAITCIPLIGSYFLIGQSLRLDEAQSLWQTSRTIPGILAVIAGDVHVPLYHILLHGWRLLFGESVEIARLFSLLFFVLSVPALYLLAKKAFSTRTGLLAALLFAASPFMNWYGNEIRMYSLFVFLTIVNQYFFLRLLDDEENTDRAWALYTLSAILGVFSHYFFFLSLLAQAVFYFLRRDIFPEFALRRFIGSALVIAVSFAPWVWYVVHRGIIGFQEPVLTRPSFVDLFSTFAQFIIGFQTDVFNTVLISLWPLAVIFGLISLRRHHRPLAQTEYLVVSILLPFLVMFFGSQVFLPFFVSRYLIFVIPALYILLINLFSTYAPKFRVLVSSVLVVLMFLSSAIQIVSASTPVKEDYQDAVTFLTAHATAQDVILVSAPFTIYPIQYYYRGTAPLQTLPVWNQYDFGPIPNLSRNQLPAAVASTTRNYQNVYLLLSYDQGYEQSIKDYFDSHYERIDSEVFSKDLAVYGYRLRYNTPLSAINPNR